MSDDSVKIFDRMPDHGGVTIGSGEQAIKISPLTRIGETILKAIAIVWLLMWVLLFGHMGAVCTGVLLHCLLNMELPLEGYCIILPTTMLSLLSQIVLSKPWPGRFDPIRRLLRGLTAIPLALVALAIAGGVLIYAFLQLTGSAP